LRLGFGWFGFGFGWFWFYDVTFYWSTESADRRDSGRQKQSFTILIDEWSIKIVFVNQKLNFVERQFLIW
jgi:hypothetical protein